MVGQAAREIREELLGGRVDPVEIFDDQDQGGGLARTENHLAKGAEGALLELGARQAIEKFLRGGHAQEVGEQDTSLFVLQAQESKLFGDAAPEFLAGAYIGETEVPAQQLHDGAVRHGAAIGHAGRFQLEDPGRIEPSQELVEQA